MSSTPSTPNPYIDEQGRTDAEVYLTGIYDGEIVASKWMRMLAEQVLPRFHDEYKGFHYDVDRAIRPCRFIEDFCVIPEGEKMWQPFVMEPFQKACVQLAYGFVDENDLRKHQQVLYCLGRKNGKAVTLSTELPTPNGWRTMGDIHPGDCVFGQDGKPSLVIAESEIFNKETYRVTFEDGSVVDTSGDHVWTVQTKKSRKCAKNYKSSKTSQSSRRKFREGGWFETTTQEMYDDPAFVYHRSDGKGCEYKYRIPMCMPVEYAEKDLPIDPYTFGYWLGDGDKGSTRITVGNADAAEAIAILTSLGHTCDIQEYEKRATRVLLDGGVRGVKGSNDLRNALRELDVLNNKHIPDVYLQASVEQRWELLRGLMDTDGYVSKAGQCQFVQKRKELVEQLVELCSSLGIKANMHSKDARCNGKPAGVVYIVEFWTDKEHSCFHFKRKHDRLKNKLADRMKCKSIVSVERVLNEPTKCITIDNPSHLYLVGRQYTATHNSSLIAGLGLYHLTSDGEKGAEVYACATSETQSRKIFGAANEMAMHSPALAKRIRRGMSQKTGRSALNYDKNGSMLCAIAASPKRRDGASCSALLYDELAAVEDNGFLLDQMEESMSARREPMTWILSSENFIRSGIWDERISYCKNILEGKITDETVLPLLFVQDDRSEVIAGYEAYERGERPDIWMKANPGLYAIKDVNKLAQRVRLSINSPRRLPSVLTKEFCIRSGSYSAFLDIESCINETPIDFDEIGIPSYVCVGFDLASRNDLCAAICRWRVPGDDRIYEIAKFWLASEMVNMQTDDNQKDNVPYLTWSSQGQPMDDTVWHYVEIVEGDRVNQSVIIDFLNDLVNVGMYPFCVGYDPWHVDDFTDRTIRRLVGDSRVYPVPQTARVISPLMRRHELDLKARKVICTNPCLHHSRSSVQARIDNNDNVFPQKKDLQPNQKIDGFMAELFALAAEEKFYESYMSAIGYELPATEI